MPFDVLPQETQTEVGRFQKYAEAMLRGCAVTAPLSGLYVKGDTACAIGAMWIGLGYINGRDNCSEWDMRTRDVQRAYVTKYGTVIQDDNDERTFTREQIAARIAAL